MNRMVKKFMVVLLSAFMFLGAVTTPVQAKGDSYPTSIFDWFRLWQQPQPEEPTEPAPEETPAETEKPAEETAETEQPAEEAKEETPVVDGAAEVTEPAPEATNETVQESAETPETEVLYPELNETKTVGDKTVKIAVPEGALPEGTTVEVTEPNLEEVQATVNDAEDINGTVLVAVDITFYDVNGEKIEPEDGSLVKVNIFAPEIAEKENVEIVHLPDEAEPETVEQLNEETAADEVVFESGKFSIYAIIEGDTTPEQDTPYRATYKFFNADGSEYKFYDAAGRYLNEQILKNGETLEDVGIPTKGASQNTKFLGWFDGDGNKVETGKTVSVDANKTVNLTARFQGIINVFFVTAPSVEGEGRSVVTVKQIQYTTDQTSITVDTTDVTTEAPSNEQAVVGWSLNAEDADHGILDNEGIIDLTGRTGDVTVYPVIMDAHWLTFDENDEGTGGGASYTPPQYVLANGVTSKPSPDPHRDGYSFGGWYEEKECTTEFVFGNSLNTNKTVYAKWNPDRAPYTIVIWKQKVTDSKNAAESARTYDYVASVSETGSTNNPATIPEAYESFDNNENVNLNNVKYSFVGFHYSRKDDDKLVNADGSTVLNVYYDRNLITINYNCLGYEENRTYTGLFGQTLESQGYTWPTKIAGYNVLWYYTNGQRTTTLVFLDAFLLPNQKNTTINLTVQNAGSYAVNFYKQNVNGSYPDTPTNSASLSNDGDFIITDKYNGFTAKQYRYRYRSYGQYYWTDWYDLGDKDSEGHYGTVDGGTYYGIDVRFARNTSVIEFHNGVRNTQGAIVDTVEKLFGAPLNDVTTPTVTYPGDASDADHYEFVGWFADPQFTRLVTFEPLTDEKKKEYTDDYGITEFTVYSEMPESTLPLYAGWFLKGYDCALNPNGGTLARGQAGVFWMRYNSKISDSINGTTTRDGYKLLGWNVSTVDGELIGVYRDDQNLRQVGSYSNWSMTETPWNFETGITGPVYLTAKWYSLSTLSVVYDPNGGTHQPTDTSNYRDEAQTVVLGAPEAPEKSVFEGWDIIGTEEVEHLYPGDAYTINSQYAKDGVITLKAVYHEFNKDEELPVSYINWYRNWAADDTVEVGRLHQDADLQINKGVKIYTLTDGIPTRKGYKFLGWARMPEFENNESTTAPITYYEDADLYLTWVEATDTVEAHYECEGKKVTEVAADEKNPYEAFYAVWEEEFFYIYHSSDQSVQKVSLVGIDTFDITDTVKEGFMYGGYYKDYARKGTYTGGETATKDGTNYNGGLGYWKNKNAWGSTKENGEGGIGTAMTPVAGHTYYLKEVSDKYLSNLLYIIYDTRNNNTVVKNYLITNVDDNNYKDIGLIAEHIETGERVKLSSAFTITNTFTGKTDKISARKPYFDTTAGYIGVWNPTLATEDYNFASTYTTYDGVKVEGSWVKNVTLGDGRYYGTFDDTAENSGYKTSNPANTYLMPEHAGHLSLR